MCSNDWSACTIAQHSCSIVGHFSAWGLNWCDINRIGIRVPVSDS